MDLFGLGSMPGTPSVSTGAQSGSTQTASPQSSFEQVLGALTTTNYTATYTNANKSQANQGGLTWREIQANLNAQATAASNTNTVPLDGQLAQLLQAYQITGDNLLNGTVGADKAREVLALLEMMQQRLKELMDENGQEVAGQQLLALLSGLQGTNLPFLADAQSLASGVSDPAALLQTVLTDEPASTLEQFILQSSPAAAAAVAGAKNFSVVRPEAAGQAEMETEASGAQAQGQKAGEMDFDAAIRTAKNHLAETEAAAPPKQETDIDALQGKVDTGAYLKNTSLNGVTAEKAEVEEAPPLRTQVESGILTGIKSGQNEFTIKLKPEGMGELTIRLGKTAEGMNLNIIAKNAETQKMLSEEAHILREALRPYKVEVDSILTEQQHEMLNHQQSFEQQQRQNWREFSAPAYYGDEPLGSGQQAEPAVAAAQAVNAYAGQNVLDTYI